VYSDEEIAALLTAEAELALAVRLGLVHPSLVKAPSPNGNGQLLASTSKEGYT